MRLRSLLVTATAATLMGSAALAQTPAAPAAQTPATETPAAAPAGSSFTQITPAAGQNTVAVLTASGQFTTFLKALAATNLTTVLNTPNLTVFAPTDSAFAALPAGQVDAWMKDLPTLQKALTYHLVNAPISAAAAKGRQTKVATAAGTEIWVDGTFDPMKVNDATVLQADVGSAGGGHIWVIDKVVTPGFTPPAPGPQATLVPDASEQPAATATATEATTTTTSKTTTRRKK